MEIQDIINMSKNTTITNNSQYDGDKRIQGTDVARDRLIQNTLDRMRHPASKVNIVADSEIKLNMALPL